MSYEASHRAFPAPSSPWVMVQRWHDLLFAHWPIPVPVMRAMVPAALELDTFEGQAWLGIVPFPDVKRAAASHPASTLALEIPELNVRTYVVIGGKPGVYFFSLDAGNPVAVQVARRWFHLRYFDAAMTCITREGWVHYESRRIHWNAAAAALIARYRPTGPVEVARPGTLQDWLTSRYCLYTQDRRGRIYRGDIDHRPWPLQTAELIIGQNTMADAAGLQLPEVPPLLAFSRKLDVHIWPLTRCDADLARDDLG